MYWGQLVVALSAGVATGCFLLTEEYSLATSVLAGLLVLIGARWLFAWVGRTRYWLKHNESHVSSTSCPECGLHIFRQSGDWVLTCHNCGWKEGLPVLRWITRSVPANQLQRTVVGPQLLAVILAIGLLSSGVAADLSQEDSEADEALGSWVANASLSTGGDFNNTKVEREIVEEVNERRASRGMDDLSYYPKAANKARDHAKDMAENDYFDHTSLDGVTQEERYYFCQGGENIAQTWYNEEVEGPDGQVVMYTSEEELAEGVVRQWINSDLHRERGILGEYWVAAGVGVAKTDDDEVYVAMGFCSRG